MIKITVSLHCLWYESTNISNEDLPEPPSTAQMSPLPVVQLSNYIHLFFSFLKVKAITNNMFSLEIKGCILLQNFHLTNKLLFQVNLKFKLCVKLKLYKGHFSRQEGWKTTGSLILCLTSHWIISTHNYQSQQKSYKEVLWDGGFNDFALQSQLPWGKGAGRRQLGKQRGDMGTGGTDCSWEACSGWKERGEINVLKSGRKQARAIASEGKANVRKDRMGSWRKVALETLTFFFN